MTAPTIAVEWLLARAAVRTTGLLHVVSRRDTGALNPVCGANPIRSERIETRHRLDDIALLCEGCGTMAASIGGTIEDGVALLLGLSTTAATVRLLEVAPDVIHVPADARTADAELITSVANNGIVTPVIARRTPTGLALVDGARRLHAATMAGLTSVPMIVRDLDEQEAIIETLLANLHRKDLDPIAQAKAYANALDTLGVSKQALADGLGISRPQVSNTIRLLNLPEHLQEHIAAGTLTAEQGRALLACKTEDEQDALADALLAGARSNRTGVRTPLDDQLAGIADLLTSVLEAKVKITARGDKTQITIVVDAEERARVLSQLGVAA